MIRQLCEFSLIAIALLLSHSARAESDPPNFVVFLADDMGWGDSATYGHSLIKTSNLDKLASQGVKFTQSNTWATSRNSITRLDK